MKNKIFTSTIILLLIHHAMCDQFKQISINSFQNRKGSVVAAGSPEMGPINRALQEVISIYGKTGNRVVTSQPIHLNLPNIQKLLPGWNFYSFTVQLVIENKTDSAVAPFPIIIAISESGHLVMINSGDRSAFGVLLNKSKIHVNDLDDARTVWNAFAELYAINSGNVSEDAPNKNVFRAGVQQHKRIVGQNHDESSIIASYTTFLKIVTDQAGWLRDRLRSHTRCQDE